MASAEEYAGWIVKNADKRGTPEFETVANAYKAARAEQPAERPASPSAEAPGPSMGDRLLDAGKAGLRALPGGMIGARALSTQGDLAAGALRGAGSIGATIMQPIDWAARKMGVGESVGLGRTDRREAMTGALKEMGADTDSAAFQVGKVGAEVAGTSGVGGGLAKLAQAARLSPAAITALQTSGIGKQSANLLTRIASGGAVGGVSAGMVDPGDAGIGAGIGAGIPAAGAAIRAAVPAMQRGLDVMGRPTVVGRQGAAVRLLQRAGVDSGMAGKLGPAKTVTGASPTLAERIPLDDPNTAARVAHIQDALRTSNPDFAAEMASREVSNNAERVNTLRALAGSDGGRDFAVANRAGTSGPMYQEAFEASPGAANTSERELRSLLRTPALREAAERARNNAANTGRNVGPSNASGSVEGLHQMKMALDDMISKAKAKATGAADNEAAGLVAAQKRLVGYIESVSPEYASARGVHRQMSVPINQMDVAGQLLEKGSAPTSELDGVPRLLPNSYTLQLGADNALVKAATGRDLGSLEQVMAPEQLNKLRAVGSELDRYAAVGRAANGPGSATAKRMLQSKSGMLRNTESGNKLVLGALAIPTGGLSALALAGQEVSGHLTRKTQEELGNLLLNPAALDALMKAQIKTLTPAQQQMRALAEQALRRVPVAAAAATD